MNLWISSVVSLMLSRTYEYLIVGMLCINHDTR
jgi:hypothetical protein